MVEQGAASIANGCDTTKAIATIATRDRVVHLQPQTGPGVCGQESPQTGERCDGDDLQKEIVEFDAIKCCIVFEGSWDGWNIPYCSSDAGTEVFAFKYWSGMSGERAD